MVNETSKNHSKHLSITHPSPWVMRFAPLIKAGGSVLDLAAGGGRHGRALLERGFSVTFLDQNREPLEDLVGTPQAEVVTADLEDGSPWPLPGRSFDAVIVVNYLHRELFPVLIDSLNAGGVLIYETFARGNEAFSRPRNPDHLLKSAELLTLTQGKLQVVAYEHGLRETTELPGVIQHIAALKNLDLSVREDGEPPVHSLQPSF